jgi:hypothetical protein
VSIPPGNVACGAAALESAGLLRRYRQRRIMRRALNSLLFKLVVQGPRWDYVNVGHSQLLKPDLLVWIGRREDSSFLFTCFTIENERTLVWSRAVPWRLECATLDWSSRLRRAVYACQRRSGNGGLTGPDGSYVDPQATGSHGDAGTGR